jgi:hypothetical protein
MLRLNQFSVSDQTKKIRLLVHENETAPRRTHVKRGRPLALDGIDQQRIDHHAIHKRRADNCRRLRELFAARAVANGGVIGLFHKIDVDRNGGITLKELKRAFLRFGWTFLANDAHYLFGIIDKDMNGILDVNELTLFIKGLRGKPSKKNTSMVSLPSVASQRRSNDSKRPAVGRPKGRERPSTTAAVRRAKGPELTHRVSSSTLVRAQSNVQLPELYWKLAKEEAHLAGSLESVRQQKKSIEQTIRGDTLPSPTTPWLAPGYMQ